MHEAGMSAMKQGLLFQFCAPAVQIITCSNDFPLPWGQGLMHKCTHDLGKRKEGLPQLCIFKEDDGKQIGDFSKNSDDSRTQVPLPLLSFTPTQLRG